MNTWLKRATSFVLVVLMLLMLMPGSLAEEGGTVSEPVIPGLMLLSDDVTPLADDIIAISVGENHTIGLENGVSRNGTWTSSDTSIAKVQRNRDGSATVTGVSPGTAIITYNSQGGGGNQGGRPGGNNNQQTITITYTINVTGTEGAIVYYLKTPKSTPSSNDTNQWGAGIWSASVDMAGATWVDGRNVFSNVSSYIVSWPGGSTGPSWTIPNNETYASHYEAVYEAYKEELEGSLGITDLTQDDIVSITLIPYKISRNNYSNPDKHIDCIITVVCRKAYTVRFNVQYPGDTEYTNVSAENKAITNGVADSINQYVDEEKAPAQKEVNGLTYVFDGWYDEEGYKVEEWPHTPTSDELADGTVNFYAHYVLATTDVTITKQVTGNWGDKNAAFNFTVTSTAPIGEIDGSSYTLSEDGKKASFTLAHDESVTLRNVPVGAKLTIAETNADNYKTTIQVGSITISSPYTVPTGPVTITVTNDRTVTIDTGVSLDFLPYVLLLAVAGGAIVLLLVMKRRRGMDD